MTNTIVTKMIVTGKLHDHLFTIALIKYFIDASGGYWMAETIKYFRHTLQNVVQNVLDVRGEIKIDIVSVICSTCQLLTFKQIYGDPPPPSSVQCQRSAKMELRDISQVKCDITIR